MKTIKIGIFGFGPRGHGEINNIIVNGGEIVAVCDKKQSALDYAREKLGDTVALYDNFDEFIEHKMDAVYLANYFPEHAPYAIRALEKNIHVISECIPNGTMAEGVALVRAAEKSKAIYMLAENYPYMIFNQEMQKVMKGGTLGRFLFGEGEYNHPTGPDDTGFIKHYIDGDHHWRNYCPATYYLTHSLGPLIMATGALPVRVCALPIHHNYDARFSRANMVSDLTAVMTVLNDDESVFRIFGCGHLGAHDNSYRLCCENGQIENLRGMGNDVMLRYNDWTIPEGMKETNLYTPREDEDDVAHSKNAGHGGADYYMFKDFFACIRGGRKPFLDEYVATRMASVGILGHRSMLKFGEPMDIPDFHKEEDRKKYENDTLSPFWLPDGTPPTIAAGTDPDYRPAEESVRKFHALMEEKED